MKVYVNQKPVELLPGMTVRHTFVSAGPLEAMEKSKEVYDEWGNEIGLDVALIEGMKIFVKSQS